ncbi:MAG: hypothetical protein WCX69_02590 [Candidatus Paceibacterota bacterium]
MKRNELGFSILAAVLIIAAVGLAGAGTYIYVSKKTGTAVTKTEILASEQKNLQGQAEKVQLADGTMCVFVNGATVDNTKGERMNYQCGDTKNLAKAIYGELTEGNVWKANVSNIKYDTVEKEWNVSSVEIVDLAKVWQVANETVNPQTYRNEEFGFEFGGSGFERSTAISQNKCGIAADDKCKVLAELKSTTSKNAIAKIIVSVFSGNIADFIFLDQAGGSTYKFDSLKKQWFFNGTDWAADKNAPKKMSGNSEAYIFESGDGACVTNAIILPNPDKNNVVLVQELLCNAGENIIKDVTPEKVLSVFKFINSQAVVIKTEILARTEKDLRGQAEKVQLADGTVCVFINGATAGNTKGERLNYQCGDNKNLSMVIYGDLTEGDVWKANISNIERDAAGKTWNVLSVKTVDIAKVWR